MRKLIKVLGIVLLIASLTMSGALAETVSAQTGVTATTTVNLRIRSGPGTGYQQIGLAPGGTTVAVLGRNSQSSWIYIEYAGLRGWMAAWYTNISGNLASVPVTGESGGSVDVDSDVTARTTVNLRIRSGPGTSYGQIGLAPAGTTVPVLGRNAASSWVLIEYGGTRGWMAAWFTNISGDLASVPVSDASGGTTSEPPSSPPPSGAVTARTTVNLRLRSGPGTSYGQIGLVPVGTSVPVEGRNAESNWLYVNFNGQRGWVAAWFTSISGDLASVPVTGETASAPAPTPEPAPSEPPVASPSPGSGFELGGQTHTFSRPDIMRQAGMTWVKYQQKWTPGLNPADNRGRIDQAHGQGFRVLISVTGPLYPSSIDFAAFTEYVRGLAAQGPDGIEIWNEMNLNREWPSGQVNPSSYVNNMLAPAYNAIKSVNPNILVISGAPAPTGVNIGNDIWSDDRYMAGMRDAGAARYMDCVGVHHNAGATSPLATSGHPAGTHYSWYLIKTHNVYANTFPTTKLCYTELGYLSGEGYPPIPPNFSWASGTSVAEHAQWLGQAATWLRGTGRVRLLVVFNVDFTHYGDDPQAGYAILRPNGTCPACGPLSNAVR